MTKMTIFRHRRPNTYLQCDLNLKRVLREYVMDQVAEVVADIEAEKARGIVPGIKIFRSMLNQPALVSINSANATSVSSQNGFSTFTVNMPRPLLEVDTLQLLNSVIPLPTTNIPDTACAFWYYRLSAYKGLAPNTDNLYYNRLLPSYYKPENINNPLTYGWNRTFTTYADCATQLALAGTRDLALDNQTEIIGVLTDPADYIFYQIPYLPGDVSITYNSSYNKFQFTGNNVDLPFATTAWANDETYAIGDVVFFYDANTNPQRATYQSIQDGNLNHIPVDTGEVPPLLNSAWWKQVYTDIVGEYDDTVFYRKGSLAYSPTTDPPGIYRAMWDTHASGGPLATTTSRAWDISVIYFTNDIVEISGDLYVCVVPNRAISPENILGPQYWNYYIWSGSTTYNSGAYIYASGYNKWYKSLTSNNIGNLPTETRFWEELGQEAWELYEPTAVKPNYRYLATGFNDPNVLLHQGTGQRQWSPYALYEAGESVSYNGLDYYALKQNRNFVPFFAAGATTYSATKQYNVGDKVAYVPQNSATTFYFLCVQANTGEIPSTGSAFWRQNVWGNAVSNWSATTYYVVGSQVKFSGKYYESIVASSGKNPAQYRDYWTERIWIVGASPIIGLNAISQGLDMVEIYEEGGFQYVDDPFPEGIAGQPFNPTPRRLLNSILGFTWNGQIPDPAILQTLVIYDAEVYGNRALIGNTGVTLYNRVRPIPPYVVPTQYELDGLGVTARPSTSSPTYTAEGYANLVYTSVVSIYSTIVCGSTVNTQTNTNLLGIVGMNAGNLGVAYFQNVIDDALKLYQNDIYTISIDLRDEMDEPYYLTNNAVCSFTMKLTYKE